MVMSGSSKKNFGSGSTTLQHASYFAQQTKHIAKIGLIPCIKYRNPSSKRTVSICFYPPINFWALFPNPTLVGGRGEVSQKLDQRSLYLQGFSSLSGFLPPFFTPKNDYNALYKIWKSFMTPACDGLPEERRGRAAVRWEWHRPPPPHCIHLLLRGQHFYFLFQLTSLTLHTVFRNRKYFLRFRFRLLTSYDSGSCSASKAKKQFSTKILDKILPTTS